MGLFTTRKRRGTRRAEARALKHKATLEAKFTAKNDRRSRRAANRHGRRVAKAQVAAFKAKEQAALAAAAKAERDLFSPGQVKKYLGVAKLLVPVLTPIAYRAATLLRAQLDQRRAHRLGIGVEQLTDYSGPGARLRVRIADTKSSLDSIGGNGKSEAAQFASATRTRLDALNAAVGTAEHMPATRRRAAHASIASELAVIEGDVLLRLGVA